MGQKKKTKEDVQMPEKSKSKYGWKIKVSNTAEDIQLPGIIKKKATLCYCPDKTFLINSCSAEDPPTLAPPTTKKLELQQLLLPLWLRLINKLGVGVIFSLCHCLSAYVLLQRCLQEQTKNTHTEASASYQSAARLSQASKTARKNNLTHPYKTHTHPALTHFCG